MMSQERMAMVQAVPIPASELPPWKVVMAVVPISPMAVASSQMARMMGMVSATSGQGLCLAHYEKEARGFRPGPPGKVEHRCHDPSPPISLSGNPELESFDGET